MFTKTISAFFLIIYLASHAQAGNSYSQQQPLEYFKVNPTTLRERLLSDSMTVLEAASKVHKAKAQLNLARTQLLPSLNLTTLLGSTINPSFALSTVEYLVPFLVPAKWFNMRSAKKLMEAEKIGFLLTELNIYSSLYSLYQQILSDFRSRDFLSQNLRDTILIENIVARNYEIGQASESDLNIARSQTLLAQIQLDRFSELLSQEVASLRESLSLPLETEIELEETSLASSILENLNITDATQLALQGAPEYQQIDFLTQSAKMDRWSKIFGFISNFSGMNTTTGVTGGDKDASFNLNQQNFSGRYSLGFDYFAQISLSNRNLDTLLIHQKEIAFYIGKTVETLLSRLTYVQNRKNEAAQSEALLRSVFESQKHRYQLGEASLQDLIHAQVSLRQTSLENLRAETDLNLIRVTLHRLIRVDQFGEIKGCEALTSTPEKIPFWKFWKKFKRNKGTSICDSDAVKKRFSGN